MLTAAALIFAGAFIVWSVTRMQKAALRKAQLLLWDQARNGTYEIRRPMKFELKPGETLLYGAEAVEVTSFIHTTREVVLETESKTRGGAMGAIAGGLLAGPVGAVAGYAASKKTTTSASREVEVRHHQKISYSRGETLWVTNQRIITHDGRAAFPICTPHGFAARALQVEPAKGHSLLGSNPNTDEVLTLPGVAWKRTLHVRNGYALRKALWAVGHRAFTDPAIPPPGRVE